MMVHDLTARDYLAAHAPDTKAREMSSFDAARILGVELKEYDKEKHWAEVDAILRYRWADAMLKSRQPK